MLKEGYHVFAIVCTIFFLIICIQVTFSVREFWAFCLLVVIVVFAIKFILKHLKKLTRAYNDNQY